MIRSAITRASFRACLDDGPVLAALVSVRLLLSCSCIRGDVTRDTNLTLSFAALFSHSACVLYSRRSGNPNPKRPGAAPRKANRRISSGGTAFASDERTRMLGVSAIRKIRDVRSLVARTELRRHGSEHYSLSFYNTSPPASTVAHPSAIDNPRGRPRTLLSHDAATTCALTCVHLISVAGTSSCAAFSLSLAFHLDDGLHRVAWQRAPVTLLAACARACAHKMVIEELGDVFLECDLWGREGAVVSICMQGSTRWHTRDSAMRFLSATCTTLLFGNQRRSEAIRGDQRRS